MGILEGNQNARDYCGVLEEGLLEFAAQKLCENRTLFRDSEIHTAYCTKAWLQSKNVDVMNWPAKSPDLNIIEDVWGVLARKLYRDGWQFSTVKELSDTVVDVKPSVQLGYNGQRIHQEPLPINAYTPY